MNEPDDELRALGAIPPADGWEQRRDEIRRRAMKPAARTNGWLVAAIVVLALLVPTGVWWANRGVRAEPNGGSVVAGQPSSTGLRLRIEGNGMLRQRDGEATILCFGGVETSFPPNCSGVPATGVDWAAVPDSEAHNGVRWANVSVEGVWDGQAVALTRVGRIPPPPATRLEFPSLCTNPTDSGAVTAEGDLPDVSALPGYQGSWIAWTGPDRSGRRAYQVASSGDLAEVERVIRKTWSGPLCVGTLPGPTDAEARSRAAVLVGEREALRLAGVMPGLQLLGGLPSTTRNHVGITVAVFLATDDVVARVHKLVGPDMVEWTTVVGQFRIVG